METIGLKNARFRGASDQSLLIYFDEPDTLLAHRRVAGLLRRLEEQPVRGVRNLHPAFRSLLVTFDALQWTHLELESELGARVAHAGVETLSEPRAVEITVCYGGEFGPDLEEVARLQGMTVEEVIALHTSDSYVVFFLGFMPGFAYMGDLPEALATPRLATPRKVVPAGSVGIAGRQTGIYPFATPGGWRLLGQTPLKMFQKDRAGMCLLALGDRVKFVPISREHFRELESA
jgi:inhibitor of KinA